MQNRRYYFYSLPLVLGAIAMLVVMFKAGRDPEARAKKMKAWVRTHTLERGPEYRGKRLSEWVRTVTSEGDEGLAGEAIRQIGTNALPYLLTWISYEPALWKLKLYESLPKLLGTPLGAAHRRADEHSLGAYVALRVLGPEASPAIPELLRLINNSKTSLSSARASMAVGNFGIEALPALLAALTNQHGGTRQSIVLLNIGAMGTNARPAIPVLLNLLKDPALVLKADVTNALHRIDSQALNSVNASTSS